MTRQRMDATVTQTDDPEPVGSVAEEAAKLFGALSGWATRARRRRLRDGGLGCPTEAPRAPRDRRRGVRLVPGVPHDRRGPADQPGGAGPPGQRRVVADAGRLPG